MSRHFLFQISDVHLVPNGPLKLGVDPLVNLEKALEAISSSSHTPDAVLFTGDLSDKGDAASYELLAERTQALVEETGTTIIFVPGNHDDRATFRQVLLGEAPSDFFDIPWDAPADGDPSPRSPTIDQVYWFGNLRVVSLDSVVPGEDRGELSEAQLTWLAEELSTPAPGGTILALHHPPVTSPITPMAAMALGQPYRLAAAIDGSDVRLIVCGHNHHASSGMLGSVPVWVAPALAYRADALIEETFVGRPGGAFSRIDVADGDPLVTVIPITD